MLADAAWLAAARTAHSPPRETPDSEDTHTPERPTTNPPVTSNVGAPPPSTSTPKTLPVSARDADGTPVRGVPLSLERPSALPDALALGRALRPFRRPWPQGLRSRLDIDATVDHYARSGTLLPVFTPAPERWFEVVIVMDTSLTMTLWEDLAQALTRVLRDLGAFRAVYTWPLTWHDKAPKLHDHSGHVIPVHRAAQHSNSPRGRRLILVLTDCAAPGWRQDAPWRMLRAWGHAAPVALVDPLPRRLWHRSALNHPHCQVVAPYSAAPNAALRLTGSTSTAHSGPGQVLPVLTCTPNALRAWARTVIWADPNGCDAVVVPDGNHQPRSRHGAEAPGLEVMADSFVRTAPPGAVRLAVLGSALDSLTVAMLKVLRERVVPEARMSDLAEVLSSGLLNVSRKAGHDPLLAFIPGASKRLRQELTRRDVRLVHQAMSAHLSDHPYAPYGIQAVLHTAGAPGELAADLAPFAQAGDTALRLLGINTTAAEVAIVEPTADEEAGAAVKAQSGTPALDERNPAKTELSASRQVASDRAHNAPERGRGLLRRLQNYFRPESAPSLGPQGSAVTTATGTAIASGGGIAVSGNLTGNIAPSPSVYRDRDRTALVGVLPARASTFQSRPHLREGIEQLWASQGTLVLVGGGGNGKTQLAGEYARQALAAGEVDVLVWITANTQYDIVSGYARAAWQILSVPPEDPQEAAQAFLAWLEPNAGARPSRWLVVLDDVTDPAELNGLWPPSSPHGRTLLTTRCRDAMLTGESRRSIEVGLFTEAEAVDYLTKVLAADERTDSADELAALAVELGCLPLALSQAAAYLVDAAESAAAYRARLADRTTALADTAPDVLPDGQSAALAATWSLSLERADVLRPAGLARPMLQLASFLDPNGIPIQVLISEPSLIHLTTHRIATVRGAVDAETYSHDAFGALRALHRLSLIHHDVDPNLNQVRVHQLVQRATRDGLGVDERHGVARAAADALTTVWPEVERDPTFAQMLRANAAALTACASDALYWPDIHAVLFRAGRSLGDAGQVIAARVHFEQLVATATARFDLRDRPDTLTARANLAFWWGEAGDPAGAVDSFAELLVDQLRVLGPDHPDT
ncbi:SAV_2336 N-terminal domain-related protein, partial [Streptomyces sp. NPDC059371]|uniref:SAV_2336 N-terminal domain-related protein n=1 Tax=Streptomyces sp. NPDC059371 TaxID=3346812 RepID=UPI00369AA671